MEFKCSKLRYKYPYLRVRHKAASSGINYEKKIQIKVCSPLISQASQPSSSSLETENVSFERG